MRNLLKKINLKRKSSSKSNLKHVGRITNDTVAEHREVVLAGGRRFKYPLQYSKHKLVINSISIGLLSLLAFLVTIWLQLYIFQSTGNFSYRLSQLVPVPVAKIDGEWVRYSEYLRKYRSSIHFLRQQDNINLNSDDGKRQSEYIKRRELDGALFDAYVNKVARENDVSVTSQEVDSFIQKELDSRSISKEAYEATVLEQYYGWSIGDYRQAVKAQLLRRKVNFAIDSDAQSRIDGVKTSLATGSDFAALASQLSDDTATKALGGDSGVVTSDIFDPNGLYGVAQSLENGQTSSVISGVDAYYIIQLIEKTAGSVRYRLIQIQVDELQTRFNSLMSSSNEDLVKEYIDVKDSETITNTESQ